jgi:hypothetical protein
LAELIASRLRKKLVTARQAVELFAVDLKTVYRRAKELGGRKVGGVWRFDLDAKAMEATVSSACYASERPQWSRSPTITGRTPSPSRAPETPSAASYCLWGAFRIGMRPPSSEARDRLVSRPAKFSQQPALSSCAVWRRWRWKRFEQRPGKPSARVPHLDRHELVGRSAVLAQSPRHPLAHDIIGLPGGEPRDIRVGVVVGKHHQSRLAPKPAHQESTRHADTIRTVASSLLTGWSYMASI